jgi:hypothetical protein
MAISTTQYIDLLFKKLNGVAKTATATQKSPSNESIASPPLLRGDIIWMQSDQVPATAQVVAGITQGYLTTGRIECVPDTTVPTISGIYPTWLTNLTNWIPQEFGSTWPVKIYVDTAGAANPAATGTQIFSPGIAGAGEFFFDTQAGLLNFIGETIPSTLTAGKSIFVIGYRYVGLLGVTNLPDGTSIGNLEITGNTIVSLNSNGDIVLDPNGTGNVRIVADTSVTGNITVTGEVSAVGNITGNYILGNGSQLTGIDATSIQNGTSNVRVTANGNITVGVAGTSNVVVFTDTGEYITGLLSVTGNVIAGNVTTSTVNSTSELTVASSSNGNILLSANGTGVVKITGTTGFVVPVGNTAQRPAPVDDGTLRLNSTLNELEVYTSGGWQTVGSSAGNITVTDQQITPDGTNTVYTLDQATTAPSIMVAINGVTQTPNDGYTVTGNLITFIEAPLVSDYVDIRFLTSAVATPGSLYNTAANSSVQVNDVPEIAFTVNNTVRTKITANGIVDISTGRSIKMPLYTVSQADALTGRTEGEMIYVQNGDSGAACLAVFTGGAWKRVVLGAAISG